MVVQLAVESLTVFSSEGTEEPLDELRAVLELLRHQEIFDGERDPKVKTVEVDGEVRVSVLVVRAHGRIVLRLQVDKLDRRIQKYDGKDQQSTYAA